MNKGSIVIAIAALALCAATAVTSSAAPPPAPGGHIPVTFGGANRGDYPAIPTAIEENNGTAILTLGEVFSAPNPFRSETVIHLALPPRAEARLTIFDLRGRIVRELLHRASDADLQEVIWDGRDQEGNRLKVGVYFYRVEAAGQAVVRKLVLLH